MAFPSDEWLERMNAQLAKEMMPMIARPFEAMRRLSLETKRSIDLDSEVARLIFEWFQSRSKPGEHAVGPLFVGLMSYDARFWKVGIPLFFGSVRLVPWASLEGMPETVLHELQADARSVVEFLSIWTHCLDYAMGLDASVSALNDARLSGLLRSGDQELRSAVSQLLEHRPNPRAAMSCRMAIEMFLKAYAGKVAALSEAEGKKLSHGLDQVLDQIVKVQPSAMINRVRPMLQAFPKVGERYEGKEAPHRVLWECYTVAQYCGAALVRELVPVDSRPLLATMLRDLGVSFEFARSS